MMDAVLEWLRAGLPPSLVWGLAPRIVGVLYALCFASLAPQLPGLIGSRGISPVREQLAAARRHFPGAERLRLFPSLFWLDSSDRAVWLLPRLGLACAAWAVFGGEGSWWALLACWLILLSLDAAALMYAWDCFLFELGFLALLLPSPRALPELEAASLPAPLVAFAVQLLLIRVVWGFGKMKFVGTRSGDNLYLRGFLTWMPISTPLGAALQRAPAWLLRGAYGFMWFVEVVSPALALCTGAPRAIAALSISALMLGIGTTGNWGFFNIGCALISVVLLDTQTSVLDTSLATILSSPVQLGTHLVAAVLLLGAAIQFPLNNWATLTVLHWRWARFTQARPWLRGLLAFQRALLPFRVVHGYGAFPPNSSPPLKVLPVFQGSYDGREYADYDYRFLPSHARSTPCWVAPHHPRLDYLAAYAGFGKSQSDYFSGLVGEGKPLGFSPFSHFSWLHRVAERLLEGEPSVLALFGSHPFAERPPQFVRVILRALVPETDATQRAVGRELRSVDLGTAVRPTARSAFVYRHWLPPPELFHPDFQHFRDKSPALQRMRMSFAIGVPHEQAILIESELCARDVQAFWNLFVPAVAVGRGELAAADVTSKRVYERFGRDAVLRYERIAERYVCLLRDCLEPHLFGDATPRFAPRSEFNFHLLQHELILDGREAVEAVFRDPGLAVERARRPTAARALHFIAVVRNETLHYHYRTLYVLQQISTLFRLDFSGIFEWREQLAERGAELEVPLPRFVRSGSGEWTELPAVPEEKPCSTRIQSTLLSAQNPSRIRVTASATTRPRSRAAS